MENLEELFKNLVVRETKDKIMEAETMKEVWPIIKNRTDAFSVAIRNVIIDRMTELRRSASKTLQFHEKLFSEIQFSDDELNDQLLDFLAAQKKQIRLAEELLRDDLNLPTESV